MLTLNVINGDGPMAMMTKQVAASLCDNSGGSHFASALVSSRWA